MMSTPKKDNLWEGIQGYQDGGITEQPRTRREMFQGTVFDPLAQSPESSYPSSWIPSDEEDIINVNYFGQPQKELESLATEAFGKKKNPLIQMLMRSESAAQAGDKRRAMEAVQRSKEQIIDEEIADAYRRGRRQDRKQRFGDFKTKISDFLTGLKKEEPTQAEMNLENMASEYFSPDSDLSAENWATPASNNLLATTAPVAKGLKPNIGTKFLKGTGNLLSALAGIPGDIAKAYQSYDEDERYPALAQLMSASQGRIMPNIYAGLYEDGGIISYGLGGEVDPKKDPDDTDPHDITLPLGDDDDDEGGGTGVPPVPPEPPTVPGEEEEEEEEGGGWTVDPQGEAGDEGVGGDGDYMDEDEEGGGENTGTTSSPIGDPNVSYDYSSGQYGSGQLGTTGQYMGDFGGYGSMFGGDTGAAGSLSQAEANLGIQLTDEQRRLYGEYDPRMEEMGIRLGGRRGLLGLTRERQSQLGGAGFAGMGAGAYGESREDLMRDIAMQQRGSRADYQKGIAAQVAEDIRAGVDIHHLTPEDNFYNDYVAGGGFVPAGWMAGTPAHNTVTADATTGIDYRYRNDEGWVEDTLGGE